MALTFPSLSPSTGIQGWIPTPRTKSVMDFLKSTTRDDTKPFTKPIPFPINAPLPPKPSPTPVKRPDIAITPMQQEKQIKEEIKKATLFPHEIPEIKTNVGELGLMQPTSYALQHDATPLLNTYAKYGHPAECGPDWSKQHLIDLIKRGAHKSANSKNAIIQLRSETTEKIQHGYARIVKWGDIHNNLPKKLKLSPVAMIPHKSKKFRCILDLSFKLFLQGKEYPSVNETTTKLAKPESMVQLGLSLKRIISTMVDNYDPAVPFRFSKLDIKDGFWRCAVNDEDAWNFCYVLPSLHQTNDINDTEIVVPNSLQMGWCESPPFFCSSSETARDVIQSLLQQQQLPDHSFEKIMMENIPPPKEIETNEDKSTTLLEVFVDDFIGATNTKSTQRLLHISRAMLHGIHSIFPPPSLTSHEGGDPISEKKLNQGDGTWATTKEILGWIINGEDNTIQLPTKKSQEICTLIKQMITQKRSSLNKYQKLAGKLQHASYGLPGGKGLFSPIQQAMAKNPSFINITKDLITVLTDWKRIIKHMAKNPSSVLQLVTSYPDYIGYSDSCKQGVAVIAIFRRFDHGINTCLNNIHSRAFKLILVIIKLKKMNMKLTVGI